MHIIDKVKQDIVFNLIILSRYSRTTLLWSGRYDLPRDINFQYKLL